MLNEVFSDKNYINAETHQTYTFFIITNIILFERNFIPVKVN